MCDSAASSLLGVGVAGPSRSQESTVPAHSAPPSVDSFASVKRDLRPRSHEFGGSSGAAPALALPGPHCLASRGLVDECTLAGALWTAPRAAGFVRGLDKRARRFCRDRSLSLGFANGHRTGRFSSDWSRSRERSWRTRQCRRDRAEALDASQDRRNSGLQVESAPVVVGSSIPQPKPSLQDLTRLFLSLSWSREQWDAVAGCAFSAATVFGAGSLPGPAVLVPVAAPSACSSARVSAPGEGSPTGVASATGSPGRRERSLSPPALSAAVGARLAGRGPSRGRSVVGVGLLPLPALLVWLAHPRPLLRLRAYRRA